MLTNVIKSNDYKSPQITNLPTHAFGHQECSRCSQELHSAESSLIDDHGLNKVKKAVPVNSKLDGWCIQSTAVVANIYIALL